MDDFADGFPSNYDPNETMGHLRLHPGSASHGCVTVPYPSTSDEWQSVNKIIQGTKLGDPIIIDGVAYPNYGTLTVTGDGFGSVAGAHQGGSSEPSVPGIALPALPQLPSQ